MNRFLFVQKINILYFISSPLNEEIHMKKNCFFCKVSRDITGTGLKRLAENENFILIRKNHCKKGL